MAQIAVLGAGYVGVCTGVVFASRGHEVTLVDVDKEKIRTLSQGRVPFHEPGVEEAIRKQTKAGRIRATVDSASALAGAEFAFLCVGTPRGKDGTPDLRFLRTAARQIGRLLRSSERGLVVVVKSTVLPGTSDLVAKEIAKASGRRRGEGFDVASNPEFLREGSALQDAQRPDRIVVGAPSLEAAERLWALYADYDCPKVEVTPRTAEMIKYASNAFLAAKIGLSNELANVCERARVDWYEVAEAIGHDPRIGAQALRAGAGFGGSCFPKDVLALTRFSRQLKGRAPILETVLAGNEQQPLEVVRLLRKELPSLRGKRVALLGLAFKSSTDDVRETRALPIFRALRSLGATVVCHDPKALENFRRLVGGCEGAASAEEALRDADAGVVQTDWPEYRALPPRRFLQLMRTPVVIDGRRTFDPLAMLSVGVRYRAIGLGEASTPMASSGRRIKAAIRRSRS